MATFTRKTLVVADLLQTEMWDDFLDFFDANFKLDDTPWVGTKGVLSVETSSTGLYCMGVGGYADVAAGNTEYLRMYHDGSGSLIDSNSTG